MCNETFCDFLVFASRPAKPNDIKFFMLSRVKFQAVGSVFCLQKSFICQFYLSICWIDNIFNPCWPFRGKKRRNGEKSCKITITISIKNRFINMASWLIPTWIHSAGFIRNTKWVKSGCQIPPTSWIRLKIPDVQFRDFWWFVKLLTGEVFANFRNRFNFATIEKFKIILKLSFEQTVHKKKRIFCRKKHTSYIFDAPQTFLQV